MTRLMGTSEKEKGERIGEIQCFKRYWQTSENVTAGREGVTWWGVDYQKDQIGWEKSKIGDNIMLHGEIMQGEGRRIPKEGGGFGGGGGTQKSDLRMEKISQDHGNATLIEGGIK